MVTAEVIRKFEVIRYWVSPTPTAKSAIGAAEFARRSTAFWAGAGKVNLVSPHTAPNTIPITMGFLIVAEVPLIKVFKREGFLLRPSSIAIVANVHIKKPFSEKITAIDGRLSFPSKEIAIGTPNCMLLENTPAIPNIVCPSLSRWRNFFPMK